MPRIFIEGCRREINTESEEYKAAEKVGFELSQKGFVIVSSAGKGISEAAFLGAIRGNDNSKRVAIDCSEINLPRNSKFTDIVVAKDYFDMKMKNCINSDGFIFFSGGFEVLSNLSIILQLKELDLMGEKPVICIGEQLEETLGAYGFHNEDVVDSFSQIFFVNDADEAINKTLEFFNKK